MTRTRLFRTAVLCLILTLTSLTAFAKAPTKKETLAAMKKASCFMAGEVSYKGGYLFSYTEDLSDQWGEAPARRTQIWVQTATPDMGESYLAAWKATGDSYYLDCAKRAANALIYGQHPLGGWHYFIEFDKPGLAEWYETTFSRFKWGMEEYRHYYGNCTYDDDTTQSATRYLLHLYMATLDPAYREPLVKALDFILMSQYPNGAWPQRYPLHYDFVHDGLADYTSYYTMNDNTMRDILYVLMEAWEELGDERYLKSALRGIDWMLTAQGPPEQAGWAEQYTMDIEPAWARTHEPKGYMVRQTVEVCRQLMDFYLMTGDRRYLSPVPNAVKWMKDSTVKIQEDGRHQIPRYSEVGTNKPVYQHRTDKVNEEGYGLYIYNDDPTGVSGGWIFNVVDIKGIEQRFEKVNALSPEEAKAEHARRRAIKTVTTVDPDAVRELIDTLDNRGAWVTDIQVFDVTKTMTDEPRKEIRGISTATFMRNMRTMVGYVAKKE